MTTQRRTERYNGYANWQTWNTTLWLANDEGLYRALRAMSRPRLAADAEDIVRELMPDGTPDMDSAKEYRGVRWGEVRDAIRDLRVG